MKNPETIQNRTRHKEDTINVTPELSKNIPSFGFLLTNYKLEETMDKQDTLKAVKAFFSKSLQMRGAKNEGGNIALLIFEKSEWGNMPPRYGMASYIHEEKKITYHIPKCCGMYTNK